MTKFVINGLPEEYIANVKTVPSDISGAFDIVVDMKKKAKSIATQTECEITQPKNNRGFGNGYMKRRKKTREEID